VHRLWPPPSDSLPAIVDRSELEAIYAYPDSLLRPYVRLNIVCSANGKVAVDGSSTGLASPADRLILGRLRWLADVILVGAGTVRADSYRGARSWEKLRARRRTRGQAETAPIAVVTASADLDPDSALFTDTFAPPLVLTVRSAPSRKVARLEKAGAEVHIVGDDRAEAGLIVSALESRGLYRILCEGGPPLFGDFIAADMVDDLCLTIAPVVGGTGQISSGPPAGLLPMRLVSALADDDSLLMRYCRAR
jgi:riboflavin-specific deaminase-like protein